MRPQYLFLCLTGCACFQSVCEENDRVCQYSTADGGSEQCLTYPQDSTGRVCVAQTPTVCGGTTCSVGESCCVGNGKCSSDSAACASSTPGTGGCSSNADCAPNEWCASTTNSPACLGRGVCQRRDSCGFCSPSGSPRCQQCGCDGRTYESIQAACVAGIRVASPGACGSIKNEGELADAGVPRFSCGLDSQCPNSMGCCALTGECYDTTESWRCQLESDGGVLNCLSDRECAVPFDVRFCLRSSCVGPGVCRYGPRECGGEVATVCGCNGTSYTNACWSYQAGISVDHEGACP